MAELSIRNFTTLVQGQAAAMQARCSKLLDFSVGSMLRAIVEGNSGLSLWLQGETLKVLAVTRAATSSGADLDSWVADFGVTRLAAQFAAGTVTFSRLTPGAQAVVPVGTTIQTADGAQQFQVIADVTNGAYNAGLSGYVVPVGISTVNVPVRAVTGGAGGNVTAGTVTVIVGSILYIDAVTNAAAFTGGGDSESDAALRLRFQQFIASLSKATVLAIQYAIATQRLGIQHTITEHYNSDGTYRPGFFYVGIDDGTGAASAALQAQVYAAIDLVRAAGVMFAVYGPTVVTANPTMTVTVATGYDANTVKAAVGTAIRDAIKALGLGNKLPYTKLAQWAFEASSGVSNVTGILLNGATSDLTPTKLQTIKPGTVTVN